MSIDGDKTFYTETMARLLAQQGRHDRAAEVYRYLVEQKPDRDDLRRSLETVESLIVRDSGDWEVASRLIDRWIALTLRYRTIRRLQRLSISQATTRCLGE